MSNAFDVRVEELRQEALAKVRAGALEEALGLYDQAFALATDEEVRELLTINKADTLISLGQPGPEIDSLPAIVMRRRSPKHTYLAAYALQYKFHNEGNLKRSVFYGEIALRLATECGNRQWEFTALLEIGNVYIAESRIDEAIGAYERIIAADRTDVLDHTRGGALNGLGYCLVVQDRPAESIPMQHEALQYLVAPDDQAEVFIDLCYAHLELDQLEDARKFGLSGLEFANEPRQIRNAHYLLGEISYKLDDLEAADHHFDQLQRFYPNFANLKQLLYAFDLRKLVNLKLS